MIRRGHGSESGASLVLVLVLVVVFGLLIPVLGQLGSASSVATHVVKSRGFDEAAAESSVQAAIAWARTTRTAGRSSVACPDFKARFPRDDGYERNVTVKCRGFEGSGRVQEGPNTPKYALLTTGTGNGEIGVDLAGGGTFATRGPLWSNSGAPGGAASLSTTNVDVDNSEDLVGGVGPCTTLNAQIFGAPDLCDSGTEEPDPGGADDPASGSWASAVQSIDDVPLRSIPDDPCSSIPPSRIYALAPGYYHDLVGLEKLTNESAPGFCGDVVLWLQPGPGNTVGKFYFDFNFFDTSVGANWRMNRGAIVGGAREGSWELAAGESQVEIVRELIGTTGSCDRARNGVELVFGERSRFRFRGPAELELCPVVRAETAIGQAISVYGRKTGDAPPTTAPTATPITATPAVANGTFTWPPFLPTPSPLAVQDCTGSGPCAPTSAVAGTLTGRQANGAVSMTVPWPVEEGVRLDEFTIEVSHRETEPVDGDLADLRLELSGLPPGIDCDVDDVSESLGEFRIDTATCTANNEPTQAAPGADFTATLFLRNGDRDGATSTIELDSVTVEAQFTRPTLRAQAGCLVEPEGSDGCDEAQSRFINVNGGDSAEMVVWGTVYAPRARLFADFAARPSVRFARGAVLRSFRGMNPVTDANYAPFSLPNQNSYSGRFVSFEAFIDGDTGPPVLRARVYFCESLTPEGSWDPRCTDQPPRPPRITTWTIGP